jgi:pimeloyl-ACP methyl ester carboxylesterase
MPAYTGADAAPLHYDVLGTPRERARPLVMLAGGAALHPSYLGDLAGLGEDNELVAPHLRGVGNSPMPEQVTLGSYWHQAADVECLRAHLGLERVLLVGHSAGARLAIAYAAQYPRRLDGMVLITPPASSVGGEATDTEELIDKRRGDAAFDAAVVAVKAGPELEDSSDAQAAFNAWQQQIAPLAYARWGTVEQAHARDAHYDLAAARAYFSVEPPPDLVTRLSAVTAPVLVIAGAEDCGTGVAALQALADVFPAGRFAAIERCAHFPWVEQPAAFRDAVDAFLESVP